MEGPGELVGFLLDGRALVAGSPVLFGGAALAFLPPQFDFMQLLLVSLFLEAPQGAQHQRRLALYR